MKRQLEILAILGTWMLLTLLTVPAAAGQGDIPQGYRAIHLAAKTPAALDRAVNSFLSQGMRCLVPGQPVPVPRGPQHPDRYYLVQQLFCNYDLGPVLESRGFAVILAMHSPSKSIDIHFLNPLLGGGVPVISAEITNSEIYGLDASNKYMLTISNVTSTGFRATVTSFGDLKADVVFCRYETHERLLESSP